jgi:hypothetical protein
MSFPWRRDRPGQPPATQRDIRHRGTARHRRIPLQREQGARSLRRASRREDAGDLCVEEPAGSVRPGAAGGHCPNGLPVHRGVLVAGRRGQAAGGEPAIRSGHKAEWPAVMMAWRSRRRGRHLIPSRVIIKGHTGTLRARAGYFPEAAAPACRSRSPSSCQAGSARSSMPLSGLAGAAPGNAAPAPATALPGSAGMCACRGGPAVVQRSVHDLASLQYQRMSAQAWPPSGTRKASGSAMPHMAHPAVSSGRRSRCAAAGGSGSARCGRCSGLASCDVVTTGEACRAMIPPRGTRVAGPGPPDTARAPARDVIRQARSYQARW